MNISCVNDEDFWIGTPLLPGDAAFIEESLKQYCNERSSELVDWIQIFKDLKEKNISTDIKSPKGCMHGFFQSSFQFTKFNIDIKCTLCGVTLNRQESVKNYSIRQHLNSYFVNHFINKHMCTSSEEEDKCQYLHEIDTQMRIHHDKDFAKSSQSQEQKLDMKSGTKVISQISAL